MLAGNVHIAAGSAEDIPAVLVLLRGEGVETAGNPDLYVRAFRTFGIDDARDLRDRAAARALGSAQPSTRLRPARRVFVIAADSIPHEAQNALLKTLEEPRGSALFIFIHPAPQTLLPTVRSRAQFLTLPRADIGRPTSNMRTGDFLRAAPAKRLDMLKPLLEKDEDDRRNVGAMVAFLASLERTLAPNAPKPGNRAGIEAVYRARKYIGDRGALVKPLLEQIALLV